MDIDVHHTPVALPVWPKALERQFHRWIVQEPWWSQLDELRYLRLSVGSDESRPGLPAGSLLEPQGADVPRGEER